MNSIESTNRINRSILDQPPIQLNKNSRSLDPISIQLDSNDLIDLLISKDFLMTLSEKDFPVNTPWEKRRNILISWANERKIPLANLQPIVSFLEAQNIRVRSNARKPKPRETPSTFNPESITEIAKIVAEKVNENLIPVKQGKTKWEDEPEPTWTNNLRSFAKCSTCGDFFVPETDGSRVGFRWRFDKQWHCYHPNPACFRKGFESQFERVSEWISRNRVSTGVLDYSLDIDTE